MIQAFIGNGAIRFTFILLLAISSSCLSDGKKTNSQLLIGSWKDVSPAALHFTLHENGGAQSDNMATLLYKNWAVRGDKLTLLVESIGNGISFTDSITYHIEKLSADSLVLTKEKQCLRYVRN